MLDLASRSAEAAPFVLELARPLDVVGNQHDRAGGYSPSSSTCGYNIFTNCNSDCWSRYFSTCVGYTIGTLSPCFGYHCP